MKKHAAVALGILGLVSFTQAREPQEVDQPEKHITTVPFDQYTAHVHWRSGCTHSITIVENATHRVVQTLSLEGDTDNLGIELIGPGGKLKGSNYSYLQMLDIDKDGHKDLRLLSSWGAHGGQEGYEWWRYDANRNMFISHGAFRLEDLEQK